MSPKLFIFLCLVVLTTIEARHFLRNLKKGDLTISPSKSHQKVVDSLVRRRRDAEESTPELTDEEGLALAQFFVAAAWETNKEELLGGFLEEISDSDNNLTLIGWQRVLDEQGKIQEIRTIQLVIPPKPEEDRPNNIVQDDDDDEEVDDRVLPHKIIKETREIFEPLNLLGIPASVTTELFDEEGKEELVLYLDKDELYVHVGGFSIYNKTSIATPQEVSSFVASLKPKALGKPSVLQYDVDGKLVVEQSHIRPHILGSVNDHYEAPDNILREAPQLIAQISQEYPKNEIAKQLGLHYNKAYPEYKWRVLVNPQNTYVTRDVEVDLTYDNFDFSEDSYDRYFVYGVKKNVTNATN